MKTFTSTSLALLAAAALALGTATPATAASCADVLNSTPQLTSFASLVQLSGLRSQVGTSALTVFAPTNEAIARIRTITQMLAGQNNNQAPDFEKLQLLVRAHLVAGSHPENQMHGRVDLDTEAGTAISIDGTTQRGIMLTAHENRVNLSGYRAIPDVHVTGAAMACDNGWVYPVDNALVQ